MPLSRLAEPWAATPGQEWDDASPSVRSRIAFNLEGAVILVARIGGAGDEHGLLLEAQVDDAP